MQVLGPNGWEEAPGGLLSAAIRPGEARVAVRAAAGDGRLLDPPAWGSWQVSWPYLTLQALHGTPRAARLRIEAGLAEDAIELRFGDAPSWGAVGPLQTVLADELECRIPVFLDEGVAWVLEAPAVSPGFTTSWDRAVPFLLSAETGAATLCLRAQPGRLAELIRQAKNYEAGPLALTLPLSLSYAWNGRRSRPLTVDLRLHLPAEAQLEPWGPSQHTRWSFVPGQGLTHRLRARLRNGAAGRHQYEPLRVLGLQLQGASARLQAPLFPWVLESGDEQEFTLEVSDSAPEQTLQLDLLLPGAETLSFYAHVEHVQPAPSPGWLAVDLGHSSVCAALFDGHGRAQLLAWSAEEGSCLPAAIGYLRRDQVVFGQQALQLGLSAAGESAVVPSLKAVLAQGQQEVTVYPAEEPQQMLQLSAGQLAEQQLGFVLQAALGHEAQKGQRECLPWRLLLCHPARFSAAQGRAMRAAAEAAVRALQTLQPPELVLLCEPVAAALEFLSNADPLQRLGFPAGGTEQQKLLLVVDCGGQTLDLSLLRIRVREQDGCWSVRPELLGLDGFPNRGGSWVTETLAELLLRRASAADTRPQGYAPLWRRRLLHLCERLKIRLQSGEAAPGLAREWQELAAEAGLALPNAELPGLAELEAACRPALQALGPVARRLLTRHGEEQPAAVLRVGLGSQLRLLQQILQETFPQALALQAPHPKECCVLGCGFYPGVQELRGARLDEARVYVQLEPEALGRLTTSRWGIKVERGGEPWFLEVHPAGVALPADGLSAPIPGLRFGPGENRLQILENLGHEDRVTDNAEIVSVGFASLRLPENAVPSRTELWVQAEGQARVRVWAGDRMLADAPVSS